MKKVMVLGLIAVAVLIVSPVLFAADTEKPNKGKRGPQITEEQTKALQPAVDKFTPDAKTFKEEVGKVLKEEKTANAFIMHTLRKGQPVREGKEPPKGPEITDEQKKALDDPALKKFEPALADFKAEVAKTLTEERQARMFVMTTAAKALGITMTRPGGDKAKEAPKAEGGQ